MLNQSRLLGRIKMKFKNGDKVIIEPHFWWPNGGKGTVSLPPEFVSVALEGEAEFSGSQRTFAGHSSIITSIWVEFEEPIMDHSDDGPYLSGEIGIEYLHHA